MSEDWMQSLKKIPRTEIENVVRQDQHSPSFQILDWDVSQLSNLGFETPEGLFAFTGQGQDSQGSRPWSVVLKVMNMPAEEQDPGYLWYWKRDFLAYQSGLLERLASPVLPPRCYGVKDTQNAVLIWMEHVRESAPHPWNMDQFAFAARQLGRFNGRYLVDFPIPNAAWLSNRSISAWQENIDLAPAWENPYVRKYLPERDRQRVLALWNGRDRYLRALDRMPKVFMHGDCQPRNLFIRANAQGQQELVAIDWALCGCNPVGSELVPMIAFAIQFREIKIEDMQDLEEVVFNAYLQGLRDAGWFGSSDIVRLGYQSYLLMSWGFFLPGNLAWSMREEIFPMVKRFYPGFSIDEILTSAAYQFAHILDFADQTIEIIDKLVV